MIYKIKLKNVKRYKIRMYPKTPQPIPVTKYGFSHFERLAFDAM